MKRYKNVWNYAQEYILGYTWRRRWRMGPRPWPRTWTTAVAPGPPKPQGRTLPGNHCSRPPPGRDMAGRTCPSGGNPAQRRFSKPMPRSDSAVRAARIERDTNQDNPSPLATVSSAPAAARLCFRKASRPSRPASAPEPTRGHTEAKQQQTTWSQCTQQPATPARDTPESLMLVAAARRSAVQSGKSSRN